MIAVEGHLEFNTEYLHNLAVSLEQQTRRLQLLLTPSSVGGQILEKQVADVLQAIADNLAVSNRVYALVREVIQQAPENFPPLANRGLHSYGEI